MTHKPILPAGWPDPKGYANGILATDGTLYVGGQIGWDESGRFAPGGFLGQMEQALKNIRAVVEAAGGRPDHIVRLTWYVTDKRDYVDNQRAVGEAYRRVMGRHFPAMAMLVVAGLIEDEAVVEIEATAVIG